MESRVSLRPGFLLPVAVPRDLATAHEAKHLRLGNAARDVLRAALVLIKKDREIQKALDIREVKL